MEESTKSEGDIDYLTKRPREANIPYSNLTDEQIKNIKKDPSPFFMCQEGGGGESVHGPGREGGRHYRDRYTDSISQHNIKGLETLSTPWGIIGEKYDRNSQGPRTTSQIHAHFKWGQNNAGERTLRHYYEEKVTDFLNIDCYRRPPTNLPGQIIFKYGRPAGGYYEMRDPSGKLEPSPKVEYGVYKTQAEYDLDKTTSQTKTAERTGQWPEYSEYTDRYLLNTATAK